MSIRKSLMHYFDKASSKHIPIHPQTESAAITDWHESIIKSLASKVLPTVVSELTTDSVMGKLMKMLLNASGVKYSIDTNGYVCLGSFFGGVIIQWGIASGVPSKKFEWDGTHGYEVMVNTNLPIQFKNSALFAVANVLTDALYVVDEKAECCNLEQGTLTLKIASSHQDQSLTACYFIWGY